MKNILGEGRGPKRPPGSPTGKSPKIDRRGKDFKAEEISHAVLGIVKASDYLGVRWRTDPARAASYAALMDTQYGRQSRCLSAGLPHRLRILHLHNR